MGGASFYLWGYLLCGLGFVGLVGLAGGLWWFGRKSNPSAEVTQLHEKQNQSPNGDVDA